MTARATMPERIHLGFEVGTGRPVEIPIRHLAVAGQTQVSGKTTTLEALIARSDRRAIVFITKRAEASFAGAPCLAPYFRERADWQFVSAVLEAALREKMKFERAWIMRVTKGARTLADVQRNIKAQLADKKNRGRNADMYLQLDAYCDIVVPQVAGLGHAPAPRLVPGLNVMDLAGFSAEVQGLVIRSVIEWAYEQTDTITVIPEAWEFLPQQRNTPVKLACEQLIRKGAAAHNFLWLDSQDLAGVDKMVLKQIGVWILGVQREINEVKHTLAQIPLPGKKIPPEKIQTLRRGEFYVCFDDQVRHVYVQPEWMGVRDAALVSTGKLDVMDAAARSHVVRAPAAIPDVVDHEAVREWVEEDAVYKEKYEQEKARADALEERVRILETQIANKGQQGLPPDPPATTGVRMVAGSQLGTGDIESLAAAVYHVLEQQGKVPPIGQLSIESPELNVEVRREVVKMTDKTLMGCSAALIAEGFFDEKRSGAEVRRLLVERGKMSPKTTDVQLYDALKQLHKMGFLLRNENKEYQAVPDMKVNIVAAAA